jgi:predicted TIM-barrel fold metal-dependent hydrolase
MAIIEPSDEGRPLGVYDTFGAERGVRPRAVGTTGPAKIDVNWDPSVRLEDMDEARVDKCNIFASHQASYCALKDVGFESALHQAFHRYMRDYCTEGGGRLHWAALATMRDPARTVEEITYWAEADEHMAGVMLSPVCPDGRLLDNPDLHPIYQRAQELDLPILIHGGVLRPPYTAGATELANSGFLIRSVYQPWAGMTALGALIGGGVFDLYPRLRVGIFETGGGWVPWLLEQLDGQFESRPQMVPNLKRKPSEVFRSGQMFHAIEPGESQLEHCVEELGDDAWMFATDYPHPGASGWPNEADEIIERSEFSESTKAKILGGNALRLCPRLASST